MISIPEDFLHFVWKHRYYSFHDLRIANTGESVQVLHPGFISIHQGPDFLGSKIRIGELEWAGQVEIHVHARDWKKHGHHRDPNYNSVILHVVQETDGAPVIRQDGTEVPELVLGGRIPQWLEHQYNQLRLSQEKIACDSLFSSTPDRIVRPWLERMAMERVFQKAETMRNRQKEATLDWEQVLWEELAAFMGGPVNQDAFRAMARLTPFRLVRNLAAQPQKLEALLLGVCGAFAGDDHGDTWFAERKAEWLFLKEKHQLQDIAPLQLRFLRLRPAAFPTLRLSQLAALAGVKNALSHWLNPAHFSSWMNVSVQASDYWQTHYRFFETTPKHSCALGKSQKTVLLINVLIPLTILYERAHGREEVGDWLENSLTQLPAEDNRLTTPFVELGLSPENAWDSQALIQLNKHYCQERKCLDCAIGHYLIRKPNDPQFASEDLPPAYELSHHPTDSAERVAIWQFSNEEQAAG